MLCTWQFIHDFTYFVIPAHTRIVALAPTSAANHLLLYSRPLLRLLCPRPLLAAALAGGHCCALVDCSPVRCLCKKYCLRVCANVAGTVHTHTYIRTHIYAHRQPAVYRKNVESFLHDFSGACFCCASSASLQYIFAVNPATFHCLPSPAAFVQLRFYGFNMFTLILCICLVGVSVTYVVGAAAKTKEENAKKKTEMQSKVEPPSIDEVNNKNAKQPQRILGTYLYYMISKCTF